MARKVSIITLTDNCLSAFKNKDYNEAVRLLPVAVKVENSKLTITISSWYDGYPWYDGYHEAGLLHLSSRNGWLDITKKLIEQYHFDPRVRDNTHKKLVC